MSHTIVGVSPRNPLWIFEENYRLFCKLIPAFDEGEDWLCLSGENDEYDLEVQVLERGRYTITVALIKPFAVDNVFLPDLSMQVRIYYDARVAEVLGYQGCGRIPPRYLAGGVLFQLDEKRQVNYLLNDLLRHCLRNDYRDLRESGIANA